MDICRLCLESLCIDASIFITKKIEGENILVTKMIALCTGLEISEFDLMPGYICEKCSTDLVMCYSFRQRCWNSNEILQKNMNLDSSITIYDEYNTLKDLDKITISNIYCIEDDTNRVIKTEDESSEYDGNHQTNEIKQQFSEETIYLDGKIINKCEICDRHFKRKYDLKRHRMIHTGEKPHECDICSSRFRRTSELTVHRRIHTGKPYKCMFCDYRANIAVTLKIHVFKMHSANAKKKSPKIHVCDTCNKLCRNNQDLKEHTRTHTGERPYSCNLCEYRAATRTSLLIHMRKHNGVKNFVCEYCGSKFRTSSHLIAHRRTHTGEKPHECPTCLKCFTSKDSLKEHIAIHDESKQRACEYCGKKFAKRWALAVHRKWHTGEKPHVCVVCKKGFIQRHSWKTHMKNVHPNFI